MQLVTNVVHGGPPPERLFLLVHGKGADERDLEPLVPYLDPAGRFLFVLPRAPLDLAPGFQWYETVGMPKGGPQFASSVDALDDLLDEAGAEHGLAREQAVVGGFSQGGALTLSLGLRRSDRCRPAGLLVMSGFLPEAEGIDYDFTSAPPVLIQHGTADPLVPLDLARSAARTLADADVPVLYREYPMQHQVALESIRDAATWLDAVVAGARPAEEPVFEGPAPGGLDDEDSLVPSVRTENFDTVVMQSDLPVIVDFWAPWCQPCKAVAPAVEQIAAMRQGSYRVVKVNIDEEPMLAQTFGVQSIPMVALFRGGRMERMSVGAKPRPALEADLGMLVIP
ncbi:MAG TPA: thioredoxin [Acidimicrobiia bacterium]|nr:thioredoxin [Acidimicrobiia bacterium]